MLVPVDRHGTYGRGRHPANADPDTAMGRRMLLGAGAALLLGGCSGSDSKSEPTAPSTVDGGTGKTGGTNAPPTALTAPTAMAQDAPPIACVLTPELTAGPYHLDGHLARADIVEDRAGTPMELRVKVLALPDCTPLQGAAVDVWHCDAGGEYSGFNGNSLAATQAGGTNGRRFLRGVQLTDSEGIATFNTIFPGWYDGRTVHIHLKVLDGGTLASTYAGGHVAHVGQAFFDEVLTAEILRGDAYLARTGTRTTNDQDSIYAQAGPGAIAALTPRPAGEDDAGFIGRFTCMVDPDAVPPPAPLF
jgi:protocatechuate 3,4-dioxygenase beta subunit